MTTPADGARPFALLLQQYRQAARLSQEELADRAGLSARGISDLERGVRRSPYPVTVRRLADALGLGEAERQELMASSGRLDTRPAMPLIEPSTNGLPVYLSSFVGRAQQVTDIRRLLDTARLVTLVGVGGVGKTRLAVEAARSSAEAVFVDLAPLPEGRLVAAATAAALHVREQPHVPLVDLLSRTVGPRCLLLVLDNCEHVIEACAGLAEHLLRACPGLRILATSREPLGVAGEIAWRVPPLEVPQPAAERDVVTVAQSDGVQLFTLRAASVFREFLVTERNCAAVARLCRRLDGVPLALELAAARVSVLSIEQIDERLNNALRLLTVGSRTAEARQQSLRATLDWSCGLLTGQEQRLFERLSVFAGGWTLDAAEAVCAGDDIQPDEVLDLLARLVDKSLVVCQRGEDGSVRYTLLETLRQYASERLRAAGREGDRIACHHAAYFLAQAEEHVGQPPWQADTRSWFERLDREHDNYRVALAWSSRIADHRTTLRLATALTPFWDARGHLSEGQRWLEEALVFGAAGTTHERAWGLVAAADLALKRAEYGRATALFEEGLVLLQNLGERAKAARVLNGLGIIAMRQGDYPRALCRHEQALALAGELGETISQAWALSNMGFALGEQGDWERATPLLQESLKLHSERGFSDGIAVALTNLGAAARAAGDHQRALTLIDESLSLGRAHGLRSRIAIGLLQLGRTRHAMGEVDRADVLVSESLGLAQEVGELACVTECLEELGYLAEGCHQAVRAATLLGAAAALREAVGSPLPPAARAEHDRCLASVQAKLGSARFEAAWQSGQRMPVANVVRTR